MPLADLLIIIKRMRKANMSEEDILAELKKGGYEGDHVPTLNDFPPRRSETKDTKPVITLEELNFEQKAADRGIVTEAQKTMEAAVLARAAEKGVSTK